MAEGGNHVEYVVQHKICRCKVRTADPSDGPEIALELSGLAAEEPLTIGAMMQQTVSRVPNHVALCYQVEQTWMSITYQQYYDMCIAAAKSFLKVSPIELVVCLYNVCTQQSERVGLYSTNLNQVSHELLTLRVLCECPLKCLNSIIVIIF